MAGGRLFCGAALAVCVACSACEEPTLRWSVRVPADLSARVSRVEARIVRGDCSTASAPTAEVLYRAEFRATERATTPVPDLDPGTYALAARAKDRSCVWFASGCEEVTLPRDEAAPDVVVPVALLDAAETIAECPLEECADGVCGDVGPRDGGTACRLTDECVWGAAQPTTTSLHPSRGLYLTPQPSDDGLRLYFSVFQLGRLFVATRSSVSAPFGAPSEIDVESTTYAVLRMTVSSNELELVFAGRRRGTTGQDLFRARRGAIGDAFSGVELLSALSMTDPMVLETDPFLSQDGLELLFVRQDTETRLLLSRRATREAAFAAPEEIFVGGDSSGATPFLADDGLTLVISRLAGADRYLYRATRTAPGATTFDSVTGLSHLNMPGSDALDPFFSEATGEVFFASDRPWSAPTRGIFRARVCAAAPCDAPVQACPTGIQSADNLRCFTLIPGSVMTAEEAEAACATLGAGRLVSVHSAAERDDLVDRVLNPTHPVAWTGARRPAPGAAFAWSSAQPFVYGSSSDPDAGVEATPPDAAIPEPACLVLDRADRLLHEDACSARHFPVCETEAVTW